MRTKSVTLFVGAALLFCACEPVDAPPEISPRSAGCCGTIGLCVAQDFVSAELARRFPASECEEEGAVCAPVEWMFGVSGAPLSCRTEDDLEGRCLPSCMPELEQKAAELQQRTCDADHLCVPCFDPVTGEDTQACRITADPGPDEPAPMRAPCGDGADRCGSGEAREAVECDEAGRES